MPENMMCPDNKANNKNFNENYDRIFRKKKTSRDEITPEEIEEFKKEYAKEGHTVIGSDPPRPVVLKDITAGALIRSRRRHQEWINSVHDSHIMTDWYSEIKAPAGTERFYKVRKCKNCEYEQYEHPAGQFIDHQLTKECWG